MTKMISLAIFFYLNWTESIEVNQRLFHRVLADESHIIVAPSRNCSSMTDDVRIDGIESECTSLLDRISLYRPRDGQTNKNHSKRCIYHLFVHFVISVSAIRPTKWLATWRGIYAFRSPKKTEKNPFENGDASIGQWVVLFRSIAAPKTINRFNCYRSNTIHPNSVDTFSDWTVSLSVCLSLLPHIFFRYFIPYGVNMWTPRNRESERWTSNKKAEYLFAHFTRRINRSIPCSLALSMQTFNRLPLNKYK